MKKRIVKIVLAVALVLTMVMGLASCGGANSKLPAADSASGKIDGTDISWSYDKGDNVLKISGSGDIPDSASPENVWWHDVRHSIKTIEITDGITSIGDYAFYYCPELVSITIPDSVISLGRFSFAFCSSLKTLDIPRGITSVGDSCFEACKYLEAIFLPSAVTEMGEGVFAHCTSLKDAVIMAQCVSDTLPERTFAYCSSLETILFYEAAKDATISESAFEKARIDFSKAQYTSDPDGKVTLTIKYVYKDGSPAADDVVMSFQRGDNYSVVSPEINDYDADKLTISGIMSGGDIIETVTYKSLTDTSDEETKEQVSDEEDEGITVSTIITIVVFVVVIGAIIVLAIIMIRADRKQTQNKSSSKPQNKKKSKK